MVKRKKKKKNTCDHKFHKYQIDLKTGVLCYNQLKEEMLFFYSFACDWFHIFFLFISTQVSKTSDITLQDERKTGAGKSKESQINKYREEDFSGI